MPRKTTMLLSGIITAFVLMVVVGLVYGADRYGAAAAGASATAITTTAAAVDPGAPTANNQANADAAAQIAALQNQVQQYKQQLQQAYSDLQQAYDQIQTMNNYLSQSQGTGRRFRGERENGLQQQQPGGQGFFGGSDD